MAKGNLPPPSIDDKSTPPGIEFEEFWNPEDLARRHEPNGPDASDWGIPDMAILRLRRRDPPAFPLKVLGTRWGQWVSDAAKAAACPVDYVAAPLLASASALIGNARWAQATPRWTEPPHLWIAGVGDSGDGKSPGADTLMRDILPALEQRMTGDFPERHQEWRQTVALDKAAVKRWEAEQRAALKEGKTFDKPMPKPLASDIEPKEPCLRQYDITIEEVAAVLATAAPKGLLVVRDELAGWLDGMLAYNPAGRSFWIEAYGGRPYQVARRKHSGRPIEIPRLAVGVFGGTQPERLAKLITDADDGLMSRIQWAWPDPLPFELGEETPDIGWATEAFDRLRELDMTPGDPPSPVLVPLTAEGRELLREFARDMESRRSNTGGLLRSAYGKARGTALRLALVLEWLWWSAQDGFTLPPSNISALAFVAAAALVSGYFMPMAERVFGDAGATETERMAATLSRWIIETRPREVHVRQLQCEVRLPGLRSAEQIKRGADALVEADWLRPPVPIKGFGRGRTPVVYAVNPQLKPAEG
jgi:hypothetical protein